MPENTREFAGNPLGAFILIEEAKSHGMDALIMNQEAQGQRQLVGEANSNRETISLPTRLMTPRADFEKAGFVLGEPLKNDHLFCEGKLPEGWTLVATNHSLWSDILDAKGRKRGSMLYKAAFYDRDASMRLLSRYTYNVEPLNGDYKTRYGTLAATGYVEDTATEERLFEITSDAPTEQKPYHVLSEEVGKTAREELEKLFPDHKDVNAYWD